MVKALARAFRWRKMLDTGVHATLEDLARAKGVNATYVSRVQRLALLAQEIVEAILDGRQSADLDDPLKGLPGVAGAAENLRWTTSCKLTQASGRPVQPGARRQICLVVHAASSIGRPRVWMKGGLRQPLTPDHS